MNSFIFMIYVLQKCIIMTTAILCFLFHIHSPLAIDLIMSFSLHFKIQIILVNCIYHIRLTSMIRIFIILHIGQLLWAHFIPVFSESWYDTSHRPLRLVTNTVSNYKTFAFSATCLCQLCQSIFLQFLFTCTFSDHRGATGLSSQLSY